MSGSEGVSATTDCDLCACIHAGCPARETTCIYAANETVQCINFGTVFLSAMRIGKALPYPTGLPVEDIEDPQTEI